MAREYKPFTATEDQVIGKVNFVNGKYRNQVVTGEFDLIKDYTEGGSGQGFITIREANGKRTRVAVGKDSEGKDYTVELNERGKELAEKAKLPKRRGRPRNPNSPPRNENMLQSTLMGQSS